MWSQEPVPRTVNQEEPAIYGIFELADHLDPAAILSMHRALMESQDPTIAGRWRRDQVWIGGSSIGPHDADFVAPVAAKVPGLIDDLIDFTHRVDLPPLIFAAIAHAQFEAIHPFPDGNGRTGRALLQSMLRKHGVTRNVTIPVSAGLLRTPPATSHHWTPTATATSRQ